jgi:hypothetical protein
MENRRATWTLLLCAASTAACWDGDLDPIVAINRVDAGIPDTDVDTDSDADTDTDSDTDTETVPASCEVPLYFTFDEGQNWHLFNYTGVCLSDAAGCVGCAWTISGICEDTQVCCVEKSDWQSCEPDSETTIMCGYEEGIYCFDYEPENLPGVEEPICPGGKFCCIES